jgi:hypothetical protein
MKPNENAASPDAVKTTIRIRRELWKAVMHRSIDEGRSFQAIVEQALMAYLRKGGTR